MLQSSLEREFLRSTIQVKFGYLKVTVLGVSMPTRKQTLKLKISFQQIEQLFLIHLQSVLHAVHININTQRCIHIHIQIPDGIGINLTLIKETPNKFLIPMTPLIDSQYHIFNLYDRCVNLDAAWEKFLMNKRMNGRWIMKSPE